MISLKFQIIFTDVYVFEKRYPCQVVLQLLVKGIALHLIFQPIFLTAKLEKVVYFDDAIKGVNIVTAAIRQYIMLVSATQTPQQMHIQNI